MHGYVVSSDAASLQPDASGGTAVPALAGRGRGAGSPSGRLLECRTGKRQPRRPATVRVPRAGLSQLLRSHRRRHHEPLPADHARRHRCGQGRRGSTADGAPGGLPSADGSRTALRRHRSRAGRPRPCPLHRAVHRARCRRADDGRSRRNRECGACRRLHSPAPAPIAHRGSRSSADGRRCFRSREKRRRSASRAGLSRGAADRRSA